MHRPNDRYKNKGHIIIVKPTLEEELYKCTCPKEAAAKSGADLSNFRKRCRQMSNMRLGTYANCLSGFDLAMVIIHIPTQNLQMLPFLKELEDNDGLHTIDFSEFLELLYMQTEDRGDMLDHLILQLLLDLRESRKKQKIIEMLRVIRDCCNNLLQIYGSE